MHSVRPCRAAVKYAGIIMQFAFGYYANTGNERRILLKIEPRSPAARRYTILSIVINTECNCERANRDRPGIAKRGDPHINSPQMRSQPT